MQTLIIINKNKIIEISYITTILKVFVPPIQFRLKCLIIYMNIHITARPLAPIQQKFVWPYDEPNSFPAQISKAPTIVKAAWTLQSFQDFESYFSELIYLRQ
jgi:hypothetical protein